MPTLQVATRRFSKPSVESSITEITQQHRDIASALSAVLGRVRLAREVNGIHAYMASPILLEEDGSRELQKMHLAVNLDKFLDGQPGADLCGCCMKTGRAYRMSWLLNRCPTLAERSIVDKGPKCVQEADLTDQLEDDGHGNMVPKAPGLTQPAL